jgi:hypothetical protein
VADASLRLVVDIPAMAQIASTLNELREIAVATQEQIDQFVTAIQTAVDGIRSDIADVKAANPALDLSQLQAKVDALAALDAENPSAPPAPTP